MTQTSSETASRLIRFALVTVLLYFAAQTVIVILHEYAHSTAAWLLGYTPTCNTVVWGNPLTITGWDEGVPYDQLFPSAGHPAEALIGGVPLLMHSFFVAAGLYWLRRNLSGARGRWFYAVYLFVVVNMTELVAYLAMRPLAGSGDTGRFNEGLGISPWPLFLVGNALLLAALLQLARKITPHLAKAVGPGKPELWLASAFVGFMMFLGGSGLRVMALYPDPQWKWGLIGVPAFLGWLFLTLPTREAISQPST